MSSLRLSFALLRPFLPPFTFDRFETAAWFVIDIGCMLWRYFAGIDVKKLLEKVLLVFRVLSKPAPNLWPSLICPLEFFLPYFWRSILVMFSWIYGSLGANFCYCNVFSAVVDCAWTEIYASPTAIFWTPKWDAPSSLGSLTGLKGCVSATHFSNSIDLPAPIASLYSYPSILETNFPYFKWLERLLSLATSVVDVYCPLRANLIVGTSV